VKVLLVSGNRESSPEPPYPLGCAYLVTALRDSGHEVHGLDLLFEKEPLEALADAVRAVDPDVVGLSMRNLDLLTFPDYRSEVPIYRSYVERIRQEARSPIVMGGPGFSLAPESCLAAVGADAGIAGEAEVALPALLTRIRHYGGLAGEDRGRVLRAPPGVDLDRIEPDHEVFDIRRYNEEGSGGSLQTRRGCHLPCSYCSYPLLEGRRVRTRDTDLVAAEVARMRDEHGVEHVTFVDSVFNEPEDHAIGVATAMDGLRPRVRWTAFFHPVFHDPRFFDLLVRSGCEGVDLGADSLSPTVLRRLRKGFTPEQAVAFCDGCRKAGLKLNVSLLFGAPGETDETIAQTFDAVDRCDPDSVTAGIGIRLYPGARVTRELVEDGRVDPSEVGAETVYYVSEHVQETLIHTISEAARRDRRWIVPGLGVNYNPRFLQRLRKHGRKGPVWHLVSR
jgi:radical SAM superfamily enzyme YgiQ (UPF0313 family)